MQILHAVYVGIENFRDIDNFRLDDSGMGLACQKSISGYVEDQIGFGISHFPILT